MGRAVGVSLVLFGFTGCQWPFPTQRSTAVESALPQPVPTLCNSDPDAAQSSEVLFVSPDGSDAALGTIAQPLRTLARVQQMVRDRQAEQPTAITVYLRGGTYRLQQPLQFDTRDVAGDLPVIYRAFQTERPIISGGRLITGWQALGQGVYRAPAGKQPFRQFYVNGRPGIRARTPNLDQYQRLKRWDTTQRQVIVHTQDLPAVSFPSNAEMVIQRAWNQSRLRIANVQMKGDEAAIVAQSPERDRAFEQAFPYKDANQAYHWENAREFLDAPGEWFYDAPQQQVYYKLRPGETVEQIEAIAPQLETLMTIQGEANQPVKQLAFCGMTFQHTTWYAPNQSGYIGTQAGIPHESEPAAAAIVVRYARQIHLERNHLENLGGMGLLLSQGTQNTVVNANVFRAIADNAISVGIPIVDTNNPADRIADHIISNNYITQVGTDYFGSVGIFASYASGLRIEHNEITQLPYSGISVGWGWTDQQTSLGNNLIRYNHIHRVSQLLFDSGAIYTLSKQPGTVISHNYIHDIMPSPWVPTGPAKNWLSGIYLDQGSSLMRVEDNVIRNVPLLITQQQAVTPPAQDNQLRNNQSNSFIIRTRSGIQPMYRSIKQP